MPNALAHALAGAVVAVWLAAALPGSIETRVACGLLALGASLLPDIDHPKATARKAYRMVGTAGGAILLFVLLWGMGVGPLIAIAGGITGGLLLVAMSEWLIPRHRGIVHSWKFAIVIGIAAYILLFMLNVQGAAMLAFALVAGYASHLVLDTVL